MTPIVITQPSTEPITLAEAKAHLRVFLPDDDSYIEDLLIPAARQAIEQRTGRAMMPQRWKIGMDGFCAVTRLPGAPLAGVHGLLIKYFDVNNVEQTVNSTIYTLNRYVEPTQVTLAYGQSWPAITPTAGGVTMEYDVGYADTDAVPAPLKMWMLLAIGTMYENREQCTPGTEIYSIPEDFMGLLWQPYMVYM